MNWKKIVNKLLFPNAAVIPFMIAFGTVLLVYSMIFLEKTNVLRIVSYVLAFYVLVITCVRVPGCIRFFKNFRKENKYIRKWCENTCLRINAALLGSICLNAAYSIFQLVLGICNNSVWYYALSVYYVSLAMMRFCIVRHTIRNKIGEDIQKELVYYRICGVIFLLVNVTLSGMIFFMIKEEQVIHHHEITVIAIAAYTFTSLTLAIVNIIRYRKYKSPAVLASRAISLAAACVSMLILENTMLSTFKSEKMTAKIRDMFLMLSGAAVSIFIILMAFYMIFQGKKNTLELRSRKKMENIETKESFKMTYSVGQQEEIQSIRKKYMPKEEDKLEQLRAIDAAVNRKAAIYSMTVGIVGTLILGVGMSLSISDFGNIFGNAAFLLGIVIGVIGIAQIAMAYPVYNHVLKKERKNAASKIISLTDELMKETN